MNKQAFIDLIAEHSGMTKVASAALYGSIVEHIVGTLQAEGKAIIPGLGRLVVADRAARMGRNPQTGAPLEIAARKAVRFRPAKALKDAVA